jgi:hypothetical protein
MKKWIGGSLILIVLMIVAAGVYAQTSNKEKRHTKNECTFVDKNNDGKCDICGATADACKKECKASQGKDSTECASATTCSETSNELVPADEGTDCTPNISYPGKK